MIVVSVGTVQFSCAQNRTCSVRIVVCSLSVVWAYSGCLVVVRVKVSVVVRCCCVLCVVEEMASTSGVKRKHKTLNLSEKWEIIKRVDRGETPTAIAKVYDIGRPTIYDIVKNRDKIEEFMKSVDDEPLNRKTLRPSEFPEVEDALFIWFKQQRKRHAPISGDILKQKAQFFYTEITKKNDFRASHGWFENFKKRHGIRFMKMSGEKVSADESEIQDFVEKLDAKITALGLVPEQVYNADETGLNWRQLPVQTFVSEDEKKVSGRKLQKDRITLMTCANASGSHMLKLLVVGKSKQPRAFKNVKIESLPVNYTSQSRAWVTKEIFHDWYINNFVPQVKAELKKNKLPVKALLLLDNAPGHPDKDELKVKTVDGCIEVMYLPKNTTALIQPMDQNVIKTLKAHYKKRLLMDVVSQPDADIAAILKSFNIKDAILNAAFAWQQVKSLTLIKAWKNIWPNNPYLPTCYPASRSNNDSEPVLEAALQICNDVELAPASFEEFRTWIMEDDLDADVTDVDIIQEVTAVNDDVIQEAAVEKSFTVSSDEAVSAANTLLRWCQERELDMTKILLLKGVQEAAMTDCLQKKRQKTIPDFFNE